MFPLIMFVILIGAWVWPDFHHWLQTSIHLNNGHYAFLMAAILTRKGA